MAIRTAMTSLSRPAAPDGGAAPTPPTAGAAPSPPPRSCALPLSAPPILPRSAPTSRLPLPPHLAATALTLGAAPPPPFRAALSVFAVALPVSSTVGAGTARSSRDTTVGDFASGWLAPELLQPAPKPRLLQGRRRGEAVVGQRGQRRPRRLASAAPHHTAVGAGGAVALLPPGTTRGGRGPGAGTRGWQMPRRLSAAQPMLTAALPLLPPGAGSPTELACPEVGVSSVPSSTVAILADLLRAPSGAPYPSFSHAVLRLRPYGKAPPHRPRHRRPCATAPLRPTIVRPPLGKGNASIMMHPQADTHPPPLDPPCPPRPPPWRFTGLPRLDFGSALLFQRWRAS